MRVERFVKISNIKMDRFPLNESTLRLIDHIRNGGQVPAIKISRLKGGNFRIKDGRHRITAFKLLGRNSIKAKFSLTVYEDNK